MTALTLSMMQAYCHITHTLSTQYNGVRHVENLTALLDLLHPKMHDQFLCKYFFALIQDPTCCAMPGNLNCPSRDT